MTSKTGFIPQALRQMSAAMIHVIGMADLHVRKTQISGRLARKASARLRVLEQMLRRVLVLMALVLLPTTKAPLPKRPLISIAGLAGPEPIKRAKAPRVALQGKPRARPLPPISGISLLPDFTNLPAANARRPVSMARLLARIQTLGRALENPHPLARRLATRYARLKASGALFPAFMPGVKLRSGPPELRLIAGALPLELRRARVHWHDTS